MKLKTNYDNYELYCSYSKEKIAVGEQYIEIVDLENGEFYGRTYKLEYYELVQEENETPDVYILDDDLKELHDY